jgi:hypothetical protein
MMGLKNLFGHYARARSFLERFQEFTNIDQLPELADTLEEAKSTIKPVFKVWLSPSGNPLPKLEREAEAQAIGIILDDINNRHFGELKEGVQIGDYVTFYKNLRHASMRLGTNLKQIYAAAPAINATGAYAAAVLTSHGLQQREKIVTDLKEVLGDAPLAFLELAPSLKKGVATETILEAIVEIENRCVQYARENFGADITNALFRITPKKKYQAEPAIKLA